MTLPSIFAKPASHYQRLLRQQLAQFHALVQRRRFHHQHRKRRGIFQVGIQLRHGFVPVFLPELFDRFRILEENHLLRRKHRHRLCLIQRRLRFSAPR